MIDDVDLRPGDTYVNRQFFITDKLKQSIDVAKDWVNETLSDFIYYGDYSSNTTIQLHSLDNTTFGLYPSDNGNDDTPCSQGTLRCAGSSVPQIGSSALYAIICGDNEVYLGHDPYALSHISSSIIRSYACKSQLNVRPDWMLIGFFPLSSCDYLKNARYDENFCSHDTTNAAVQETSNIFVQQSKDNNIFKYNKPSWSNVTNISRRVISLKEITEYFIEIRR